MKLLILDELHLFGGSICCFCGACNDFVREVVRTKYLEFLVPGVDHGRDIELEVMGRLGILCDMRCMGSRPTS